VDERKPAGHEDRRVGQHPRGNRGLVDVETGKLPGEARLGRVAEHRDRTSERRAARWQTPQTRSHGSADALRAQLAGQGRVLATRRDPFPGELAEELHEQERDTAGRLPAGGDELLIGLGVQSLSCEHRDRVLAQPARLDDRDLGAQEELVEQRLHWTSLRLPHGEHERQWDALQPAREIAQPAERVDIRPVRVVDGQEQGPGIGHVDGEPVEPVQGGERRLGVGSTIGRNEDGPCQ
jgi:hypothetical protein